MRGNVTQGSSLPPLKKNEGKYGLIALLLLLVAGGLWLFLTADCKSEPEAEPAPAPEVEPREQFAPEIEIPEDRCRRSTPAKTRSRVAELRQATADATGRLDLQRDDFRPRSSARSFGDSRASRSRPATSERLKDDNLLQGSMTVLLTIGASGSVKAVSVSGSLRDQQVYACVKRVAKTWKFPKPEGGCVRTEVRSK